MLLDFTAAEVLLLPSATRLQLLMEWDSSFSTPVWEQIWMVKNVGCIWSWIFSLNRKWRKYQRFKRMLLHEACCVISSVKGYIVSLYVSSSSRGRNAKIEATSDSWSSWTMSLLVSVVTSSWTAWTCRLDSLWGGSDLLLLTTMDQTLGKLSPVLTGLGISALVPQVTSGYRYVVS